MALVLNNLIFLLWQEMEKSVMDTAMELLEVEI
jgi:hypothetical protein